MRSALLIGSVTILALTVLAGCAIGVEEFRFSAPSVDDRSIETKLLPQAGFEKMFILKDLAYTAFAANTQYSDAQVWVVPRVHNESPSSEPNFRIGINLLANQDGFVFDPSQVMLKLASGDSIAPTRIATRTNCSIGFERLEWHTPTAESFGLLKDECQGVALEYPLPSPDPKVGFTLSFEGLKLHGTNYEIPSLSFKQKRRFDPMHFI